MRSGISLTRRQLSLAFAAAFVLLAGGLRFWHARPKAPAADIFAAPRVINDMITYRPLLADLELLQGAGDIDFTTLTDEEWASLLQGTTRAVAEKQETPSGNDPQKEN
jgi:hypothetical protein